MSLSNLTPIAIFFLVVLTSATKTSVGQSPSKAVQTTNMKTYEIEMTTTLVIPDGNEKIDLVKVFHALPTLREWSPPEAMFDATNLKFSPDSGEELSNDETESRYLRWVVGGIQRPGTKYVFTSSMEVASPDRTLLVKAVKTKWGDYDVPPEDKNAVVDQEVAQTLHPKLRWPPSLRRSCHQLEQF